MVTIAMIALIAGIVLFIASMNSTDSDKTLRNSSIVIAIGGIIGGCFATPSRDMPGGMPGAGILSLIFIAVGVYMIVNKIIRQKKGAEEGAGSAKPANKVILIVVAIIFLILVLFSCSSSRNASHPNEPWKDLGVTKKEYTDVYNHYKYGTPIR